MTIEQGQPTVTRRGLRQKEAMSRMAKPHRKAVFIFTHPSAYGIIPTQFNSPNTALLSREAEGTALRCLDNRWLVK